MARGGRRRREKKRTVQRGLKRETTKRKALLHRRSVLMDKPIFVLKKNAFWIQNEEKRKEFYDETRWQRFRRREREAMVRRWTPGFYAHAKELRNFVESRRKWICTKRKSRREGLFGSGAIGKNIVVSKLRRMTIDSLVDCRRS